VSKAADLPSHPTSPASWPLWLLLKGLSLVACLLPAALVYVWAYPLAVVLYAVTRWREPKQNRRGRGATRNMRIAFPELDERALRRLTWRYCLHGALLPLEALRIPRMTRRRIAKRVEFPDLARIRGLVEEGRGLIIATGHFGDWEMLQHVGPTFLERPITTLARPCPERGVQRWLVGNRERFGQRILSKFGGLWPLRKALKRGEAIGLNVDENMRRGGVFVPFCGVLAATNPSSALLQRRSGAPIVVLTANRVGWERFRLHLWAVVEPDPEGEPEAEKLRVTQAIAAGFEAGLRAYPEQWLWALRRWETRPSEEAHTPSGLPPRVEHQVAAAPDEEASRADAKADAKVDG
jgi:KDO2-lipid IV(A) lauroyltransferase